MMLFTVFFKNRFLAKVKIVIKKRVNLSSFTTENRFRVKNRLAANFSQCVRGAGQRETSSKFKQSSPMN
jgi:hypothetical protein